MSNAEKTHDISRLCEALGLDPSTYVSFEKRARAEAQRDSGPMSRKQGTGRGEAVMAATETAQGAPKASVPMRKPDAAGVRSGLPAGLRPMQIALLSLTSGSGKTTMAAALANVLRARKHTVMMADHSVYNSMQMLLGVQGDSMTAVSLAVASRVSTPLPVLSKYHMGERVGDFDAWYESLAPRTGFTFVDGITDGVNEGRGLLERGARVIIPVVPELMAGMSAVTLDKALNTPWPGRVTYVLNRFDPNEALHRDVRVWLRENLGARLLPFEIPQDADIKKIAAGTLQVTDLTPYSPLRFALESLVELLEKCGAQEETMRAEVRQ